MKPSVPDRAYYRNLRRKAMDFRVDLEKKKWCDLWHTHFDWDGIGNSGPLHRRRHLKVLLHSLTRARLELRSYAGPYQLFAIVYPKSSADDALYVHTPNPNGTEFPCEFLNATSCSALPPLLASSVNLSIYNVLKVSDPETPYFIVIPNDT